MSFVVTSRRFVVVVLLATLVATTVACGDRKFSPVSPSSGPINITPVTLMVAPTTPKVHDIIVFSWDKAVQSAQLDVCLEGRCEAADMAADRKSAQFSPDEGGEWTAKLFNVVGEDAFFPLATISVFVN